MIPNFARKRQQQRQKDDKLAQQTASVTLRAVQTLKLVLEKHPQLTGAKS